MKKNINLILIPRRILKNISLKDQKIAKQKKNFTTKVVYPHIALQVSLYIHKYPHEELNKEEKKENREKKKRHASFVKPREVKEQLEFKDALALKRFNYDTKRSKLEGPGVGTTGFCFYIYIVKDGILKRREAGNEVKAVAIVANTTPRATQ